MYKRQTVENIVDAHKSLFGGSLDFRLPLQISDIDHKNLIKAVDGQLEELDNTIAKMERTASTLKNKHERARIRADISARKRVPKQGYTLGGRVPTDYSEPLKYLKTEEEQVKYLNKVNDDLRRVITHRAERLKARDELNNLIRLNDGKILDPTDPTNARYIENAGLYVSPEMRAKGTAYSSDLPPQPVSRRRRTNRRDPGTPVNPLPLSARSPISVDIGTTLERATGSHLGMSSKRYSESILNTIVKPLDVNAPRTSIDDTVARLNLMRFYELVYQSLQPWKHINDEYLLHDTFMRMLGSESLPNDLSPLFGKIGQLFVNKTINFLSNNPGKSVEANDMLVKTFRELAISDLASTQDRIVILDILQQLMEHDPGIYKRTKPSKSIINKHKKAALGWLQMSILTKHPEKLFAKLEDPKSLTDFGYTKSEMARAYGRGLYDKFRQTWTDDLIHATVLSHRAVEILAKLSDIPKESADFLGWGVDTFFKGIPARLRYIPQRIMQFGDDIVEQAGLANVSVEEMRVKTATYTTLRQMSYIQRKHPGKKFYADPENVIREAEKVIGVKPAGRLELPEERIEILLKAFVRENHDIMPFIRRCGESGGRLWKEWLDDALEMGRISKAEYDEIHTTYPYYIPMKYQGIAEMENLPLADKGTALNLRDGTANAVDAALSDPLYRIEELGKMEAVDNWMENILETYYTRSVNLYYNDVTKTLVENLKLVNTHTMNISRVDNRSISVAMKEWDDTQVWDLKLTKVTKDGEEKLTWAHGGTKIPKRMTHTHSHVRYWDNGVAHDVLIPNLYYRDLIQSVRTNVKRPNYWGGNIAMAINNPIKKSLITLIPDMVISLTMVDVINTWFGMSRRFKKSLSGKKGGFLMREADITSHTLKTIKEAWDEVKASGSIYRAGSGTKDSQLFAKHGGSLSGFIRHSGDVKLMDQFNKLLDIVEPGSSPRIRRNRRALFGGRGGYWFGKKQGIQWQDTMRNALQPDPAATVPFKDQLEKPANQNAYRKTVESVKDIRDKWIKNHPKTSLAVQNVLIKSDLQRIAENPGWYIDQLAGAAEVGTRQRLYKSNLDYYLSKPSRERRVRQSQIDASNPYGAMADDFMEEMPEADEFKTVLEFPETRYGQGFYDDIFSHRGNRELLGAIHKSRRTMIDYDQAGTAIRVLNQYFMFANPTIQGVSKIGVLLKNDPRAYFAAARMLTYIAIGTYAWNIQHPEYRNIDVEERLTKFIVMKPSGLQSGIPGEADYWTIGGELYEWTNVVTQVNAFLMAFTNKDPQLAASWVNDIVMEDLNPMSWMQPEEGELWGPKAPTYALNTAINLAEDKDSWGRPIHTGSDLRKPIPERYDENTTELAKRVSKYLGPLWGRSPKWIDAALNFGVQNRLGLTFERILSIDEKITNELPNELARDAVDTLAGLYSMDKAILDDLDIDPKTKSSFYMVQKEILAGIPVELHENIRKAARLKSEKSEVPFIGMGFDIAGIWLSKFNHQKGRSYYSTSMEDPFQDATGILKGVYDAAAKIKEPPTRQSIEGFHVGDDDPYIVSKVEHNREHTIKLNQEIEKAYYVDTKIRDNHQSQLAATIALDADGNTIVNTIEEGSPPLLRYDVWRLLNTARIKNFQTEIQLAEGAKIAGISSDFPEALKLALTDADYSMLRQNFMRGAINDANNYGADEEEIFEMENDIIWFAYQSLGENSYNPFGLSNDSPSGLISTPLQLQSVNSWARRKEQDEFEVIIRSMPRGEERWEALERRQQAGMNPIEKELHQVIDTILGPFWDKTEYLAIQRMKDIVLSDPEITSPSHPGKILIFPSQDPYEVSPDVVRSIKPESPVWVDPIEELEKILSYSPGQLLTFKKGGATYQDFNSSYNVIWTTYSQELSHNREMGRMDDERVDYELVKWGYPGNPQTKLGISMLYLYNAHNSANPDDPGVKQTTAMKSLINVAE